MLTCQMFFAVAAVMRLVWMIKRYTRWRKGVMVEFLYSYRIVNAHVDGDRHAEADA